MTLPKPKTSTCSAVDMEIAGEAITVASVVEGHGEVAALPEVLRRIAKHLALTTTLKTPTPHRIPKTKLLKVGQLEAAVSAAGNKIPGRGGILVLLDADESCPADLAPVLQARAQRARPDKVVTVVLAKCEFEAWFLAAAPSLSSKRDLKEALACPQDSEAIRDAKGWLTQHMPPGRSYKETADQPALAALFDLDMARANASSFDKLWREAERLLSWHHTPLSDRKGEKT